MHTAYDLRQLLKLPLHIESIKAFGDNLLVGTKQGHLLMYTIKFSDGALMNGSISSHNISTQNSADIQVQLLRSNKYFSKKPIIKLDVVPEFYILVALSGDGSITVHDMDPAVTNFPVITSVAKAKPASIFSLDVLKQTSLTGDLSVTVRMVVGSRRKLQFYYWKNRKFHQYAEDVVVQDIPKSLAWRGQTVCVGFRSEYSIVKLDAGEGGASTTELFPAGRVGEPNVSLLSNNHFALSNDSNTIFVNCDSGEMTPSALNWTDTPMALAEDPPYLLSVQPNGVEIKTNEPRISIQSVELTKPKLICECSTGDLEGRPARPGLLYVASSSHIWCLRMVSIDAQITQLKRDKQYELAITLAQKIYDSSEEQTKRITEIETLHAFDLFCNSKFKEAMEIFFKLNVDASHVIGLYSDLLPKDFQDALQYPPDCLPKLQGRSVENAILALIAYLVDYRTKMEGITTKTISVLPMVKGPQPIKYKKAMTQILDTTLLKCYLRTNHALVAPLLRLKSNQCHLEETENTLIMAEKYSELVIFYNTRNLHKKALELLRKHIDNPDSSLKGHRGIVKYLQNLGPEHIELICEYATYVLKISLKDGLRIFTEDHGDVESWNRMKVYEFLQKVENYAVIEYLEHIITNWGEESPYFHNALVLQYKDLIVELTGKKTESDLLATADQTNNVEQEPASKAIRSHKNSTSSTSDTDHSEQTISTNSSAKDGNNLMFSDTGLSDSPSEESIDMRLRSTRTKLHEFLSSSIQYRADLVLAQFPQHCLHEERAILLGSLGRHKEALVIHLYLIGKISGALEYCSKHYSSRNDDVSGESQTYTLLYRLLVKPPDIYELKTMSMPENMTTPTNIEAAIQLLRYVIKNIHI